MGVVILQPRDCFTDLFSRTTISPPHREKKPTPNRRRRTPPRHQPAPPPSPSVSSFIPKGSKKNLNHHINNNIVSNHGRILKRGEEMKKKISDPTVEKPDLKSACQIGSDPVMIPTQIRGSDPKSMPASFYAGPVTSTSPPASEVPLPAFFAKKSGSMCKPVDATTNLIRILGLDIA